MLDWLSWSCILILRPERRLAGQQPAAAFSVSRNKTVSIVLSHGAKCPLANRPRARERIYLQQLSFCIAAHFLVALDVFTLPRTQWWSDQAHFIMGDSTSLWDRVPYGTVSPMGPCQPIPQHISYYLLRIYRSMRQFIPWHSGCKPEKFQNSKISGKLNAKFLITSSE